MHNTFNPFISRCRLSYVFLWNVLNRKCSTKMSERTYGLTNNAAEVQDAENTDIHSQDAFGKAFCIFLVTWVTHPHPRVPARNKCYQIQISVTSKNMVKEKSQLTDRTRLQLHLQ